MFTLSRKFRFEADRLAEISAETLGATIYADGSFEAAADGDLPGGKELPISDTLVFRVTAKNDLDRAYWSWALLGAAGEGATLDTSQTGYWQPTNETEPSWVIRTTLAAPTVDLLAVVFDWLTDAEQEAVYLEFGGVVYILDRADVPTFQAVPA